MGVPAHADDGVPPWGRSDEALASVAPLLRGLHDAASASIHVATPGTTRWPTLPAGRVRVSLSGDAAERAHAQLEATVLSKLRGTGAPLLFDFRSESHWFETPVMCTQFVDGEERDLISAPPEDVERLGAVVASVHNLPVDDLVDVLPGARTLAAYVEERFELNASYLPRLRHPPPAAVRSRVERAFSLVATRADWARRAESFRREDRLVLLHGDVAQGNILWSKDPVLIDWEYARLGDAADEVAYVFGQHGFTTAQRSAFWAGYGRVTSHPRLDDVVERAAWWEPVLLLGSALWWLERWSRSVDADAARQVDPSARKPPTYYLDEATRRLDRFDKAISNGLDQLA